MRPMNNFFLNLPINNGVYDDKLTNYTQNAFYIRQCILEDIDK